MPIAAIIKRLRKEPYNCSTRDILDMSPYMIRNLLSASEDEEDRQMAKGIPRLPLPPSRNLANKKSKKKK